MTLTKQAMTDNLHLAAEEIILLAMAVNRQGIAQAHISYHPHAATLNVRIFPADTSFIAGTKTGDPLGQIDERLTFWPEQDDDWARCDYQERMRKIEQFSCYLDHLLAMNKRIQTKTMEKAA